MGCYYYLSCPVLPVPKVAADSGKLSKFSSVDTSDLLADDYIEGWAIFFFFFFFFDYRPGDLGPTALS